MTITRGATGATIPSAPRPGHPSAVAGRPARSAAYGPAARRLDPSPRGTALVLVSLLLAAGCADRTRGGPPPVSAAAGAGPVYGAPAAVGPPAPVLAQPAPLVEAAPAPGPQAVVRRGTGVFVNPQPSPAVAAAEVTEDGEVTLNFVNADLREVVRVVLADILGMNYLIAPDVAGTVTIQTERPIPRAAVLDVFERALQLSGAALVAREGLVEVVAGPAAAQAGPAIDAGRRAGAARTPGFGVEIVPLRFIAASEMLEILQPVISPETVIQVDAARNLLVVAGSLVQRRSVAELVDTFDVDWLQGKSVGVFPLESAAAEAMAGELQEIFEAGEGGALAGVIRFVPVERLNAVLAISTQPQYLDRAEEWIRRLDQGMGETTPQVFVYYVQNKRAADLAATLTEIFAPGTAAATAARDRFGEVAPGRTGVEILAGQRPRSLELFTGGGRGGTGRGGAAGALGGGLSAGGDDPSPTESAAPGGAAGSRLSQRLGATPRPDAERAGAAPGEALLAAPPEGPVGVPGARAAPGAAPGAEGTLALPGEAEVRIIADETSNALVILATTRDYRMIEAALRKLDILPLQVLIEATIAEVTLTDQLEYGLQWFFESGEFAFSFPRVAASTVGGIAGRFNAVFSSDDARVVLSALASITDLNVISAPQLMVIDNQTAVLQVGDQVPVATQQVIGVEDPDAPVRNSIEYRDTGTILLVTPRVNTGGLVTLEVEQEISDAVETETSEISSPTIQRRLIQTTVAVQSGETLALGGLIRDRTSRNRTGVPLLMDIPILGGLFRRTDNDQLRTEILVLITPRVVRNEQDARRVTEELRQRLRSLAPLESRIRGTPGATAPGT